ncbi:hypothetical protein J14TS2_05240 [Bacillus sp. J14TS2]|uniref:SLC13 family permease n=1 Tax=Bacillus sp. J14TS2 TaxID=2807188 RepID=UPI001B18B2BC|nr:SLC13 family permease [Bacillus sp. J14TS2]GIN70049.1 hypothetical protein J14TS2_05240 [Bacillus sp. J14TS2]
MSLEIITIIVLLFMFIIGSFISVNMGVLGFVAAFVVGSLISGLSIDEIYSVFPVGMFILLAGVSFLFAVAQNNGTLDLIISWGLKLVKGNVGLLPWVLFGICALLTTVGVSTVAVAPILYPIGLQLAYKYKINPILVGILISTGIYAGSFSPINLYGLIVQGIMGKEGIVYSPISFFINCLIYYVAISIVVFILFGGIKLLKVKSNVQTKNSSNENEEIENKLTPYRAVTILGILLLVVMGLVLEIDMGFGAFSIGLILSLIAPKKSANALKQIPWTVIIMVTGIVTYVGVMEMVGTMDMLNEFIASVGNSYLASLAASYIGGFVSAFASTAGFIAAVVPLAAPILQDPNISTVGVISTIAIGASVVDISPFSTNGALIMANAKVENEGKFFKNLLYIAGAFIVFGPGLAWLLFAVIGMPW